MALIIRSIDIDELFHTNAKILYEIDLYLPKEILSDVASLFNQNETHEITTSRTHGPYTCITKFPMCR